MHAKLQAIKDAWDKEVGEGRDTETANQLAREFISEFPERFVNISGMPLEGEKGLVHALDVFREAGFEENEWEIQAWLFGEVPPQKIGGNLGPEPRLLQNGQGE